MAIAEKNYLSLAQSQLVVQVGRVDDQRYVAGIAITVSTGVDVTVVEVTAIVALDGRLDGTRFP